MYNQDKHSDHFSRVLDSKCGLYSVQKVFLRFDLVFDATQPNFNLVRDFIKTNILTEFHEDWTENVASRVYTRFFEDLT